MGLVMASERPRHQCVDGKVISAVYSGDGTNYVSTSGGVLGELVSQDATTTTLIGTSPDTATFGTAVPFTARVMNSVSGLSTIVPTGTVAFLDGTITVGSAALANFSSPGQGVVIGIVLAGRGSIRSRCCTRVHELCQ